MLVIFSCEDGSVESLALAAAVGAVQGRALIRLRRVPDPDATPTQETPRLCRDYVAPREGDGQWADGVVLAVPAHLRGQLPDIQPIQHVADLEGSAGSDEARMVGRNLCETIRCHQQSNIRNASS